MLKWGSRVVVVERVQYLVDFRTSPCPKVGAGKAFAI